MADPYKQAYERERQARLHAELLLNEKTRTLYESNVELKSVIDSLKSTQDQLVQSEKMASIGQLAAGVAHEINNPIGYSLSNLSTLVEYIESLTNLDEFVVSNMIKSDNIATSTEQYLALREKEDVDFIFSDVKGLLDDTVKGLHRVSDIVANLKKVSHSGDLDSEYCNINEIIEDSLKVVWNEVKYSIEVEKYLSDVALVKCHQSEIHQVLINMFINAAHACENSESAGVLVIKTTALAIDSKDFVIIEITDNGKGMNRETRKKIFDPFFTTKPVGVGTGLGLSISFGILENHGGKIDVISEEGKGTTFKLYLPVEGNSKD